MKSHRYRVTIEHLALPDGTPPAASAPLHFEATNHDDLLAIVARVRQRGDFEGDEAAAFAIGLKLLGEVMLLNRGHPLFAEFAPHFGAFMKHMKQSTSKQAS